MSEASSCRPKHCDKQRAARCAPTERCRKATLEQRKHRMPDTAAPFWVLFSKKYRKKELKKNTSEQLRLGTAVEFDDERKRVFCPPTFADEPNSLPRKTLAIKKANVETFALWVGKLPTSRRYNLLPLLRSSPGGFAGSWPYRTYPYTCLKKSRTKDTLLCSAVQRLCHRVKSKSLLLQR